VDAAEPQASAQVPGWLGWYVHEVYRDQATAAGLDYPFGVCVDGVAVNTPAERTETQADDLLLTVEGRLLRCFPARSLPQSRSDKPRHVDAGIGRHMRQHVE
jgi:hypothetical protein